MSGFSAETAADDAALLASLTDVKDVGAEWARKIAQEADNAATKISFIPIINTIWWTMKANRISF